MIDYSVYPRTDSPHWWIAYFDASIHRRKCRSSGFRRDDPLGYKHAIERAREWAENGRGAREAGDAGRWDLWVEAWMQSKFAEGQQARTLRAELHRWRFVRAFLAERKVLAPIGVTYQHGLDFMAWRQEHTTRSGKGGHNNALGELRLLGRVMREAVRRGFVVASPLERMGLKRHKPAEKPEITAAELRAIRAALRERESGLDVRERWMTVSFEIALHQGCRLSETSLPMDNIDEARGTITFTQKGDRIFTTRLHDDLRPLIGELRKAKAKRTCTLPAMAAKQWHWFFKGRSDKGHASAGVAERICFHCTRVTVITRLARAAVPMAQAMRYVGHADEAIHRIYQRLAAPDLAAATAALVF